MSTFPVLYENLPKEFLESHSLLVYKMEPLPGGKKTKIPYHPSGYKSNDPSKGETLDVVRAALANGGGYAGPGIFIQPPLLMVDLDGCVDDDKNVAPWALEIVRELNSYTELSPNLHGLHIYVHGTKPGKASRRGIEIYDSKRFSTLTGYHVEGTPTTIEDRDITDIYNRMLCGDFEESERKSETVATPSAIQTAISGSRLDMGDSTQVTTNHQVLMSGTVETLRPFCMRSGPATFHQDSPSEAVQALLCALVIKHKGDKEKIRQEFEQSNLLEQVAHWRDGKWQRLGDSEIDRAIAFVKKSVPATVATAPTVAAPGAESPRPFVTTAGDAFMLEKIAPRKVLMRSKTKGEAIFFAKSINQLFAWRGLGKTCLGLGLTAAFATGGSFLNFESPSPVNVLYIEGELPEEQMQERWKQIIGKTAGRARLVTIDKQPEHGFPSFASVEGMDRVEATLAQCAAEGFPVDVLFLDSVSTLFNIAANDEENWIVIQAWLLRLRSQGLCIFFFHHAGKSGLSRSHSKSEDMLDVSIKLETPEEKEEGVLHATMIFDKGRHGISEPAADIKMRPMHSPACPCKVSKGHLVGCRGDSVVWEHQVSGELKKKQAFEMFALGASPKKVSQDLFVKLGTAKTWRTQYGRGVMNQAATKETEHDPRKAV